MHYLQTTSTEKLALIHSIRNEYGVLPVPGNSIARLKTLLEEEETTRMRGEALLSDQKAPIFTRLPFGEFNNNASKYASLRVLLPFSNPLCRLMRFLQTDAESETPIFKHKSKQGVAGQVVEFFEATSLENTPIGLRPQTAFVAPWKPHVTHFVDIENASFVLNRTLFSIFGPHGLTEKKLNSLSNLHASSFTGFS
jgi:hypothetical protein